MIAAHAVYADDDALRYSHADVTATMTAFAGSPYKNAWLPLEHSPYGFVIRVPALGDLPDRVMSLESDIASFSRKRCALRQRTVGARLIRWKVWLPRILDMELLQTLPPL